MDEMTNNVLTVEGVRRALDELPATAEVVAYADWEGDGERPFGLLDERLRVCGYFSVTAIAREEEPARGVIVLGKAVD